jgi:hypothetical protein
MGIIYIINVQSIHTKVAKTGKKISFFKNTINPIYN